MRQYFYANRLLASELLYVQLEHAKKFNNLVKLKGLVTLFLEKSSPINIQFNSRSPLPSYYVGIGK